MAQRAFEQKFSWYLLLYVLTSRKVYETLEYYTKVMPLLAQTFSKGYLAIDAFEEVWVHYNFFSMMIGRKCMTAGVISWLGHRWLNSILRLRQNFSYLKKEDEENSSVGGAVVLTFLFFAKKACNLEKIVYKCSR